jgi:hypothetical protein
MKFLVIRKADAETEAFTMPSKQLIDDMQSYNESMVKAGIMRSGDGLMPSARGARVSFSKGKPTIIDGPFAEAKELIAGFSILEVGSLQEAIDWVKKWPQSDGHGNVQIEIRQLITDPEDLGFTPEQVERVELLRQKASQQQQ